MEAGTVARVVQDFLTVTSGEISLRKNEMVQIIERLDRIWCVAQCSSKRGKVPLNNLLAVDTPALSPGQALFIADAEFNTKEPGDLVFMKGEIIIGDEQIDSNWWQGHVDNIRRGIFPISHVWQLDTSKLQKQYGSEKKRMLARVITSMKAQLEEEMDLVLGETIVITEQIDSDWYRGESGAKTGIFPAAYVEILENYTQDDQLPSYLSATQQETQWNLPLATQNDNTTANTRDIFSSLAFETNNILNDFNTEPKDQNVSKAKSNVDLMTFSPEKQKNVAAPSYNWKDAISDLDFLEDDYFKQNMPGLFSNSDKITKSNIFPEAVSHHSAEVDIIPYGITLYPFYAQFPNELSFNEGEIVHLLHYIDSDWIKGEIDGKTGIFPTSYVNIVVNCDNVAENLNRKHTTFQTATNLQLNSFAKVLYTFTAQMNGDISVVENELVYLVSQENDDWWRVRKQNGSVGLCPRNYLTPYTPDADATNKHAPAISLRSNSFSGCAKNTLPYDSSVFKKQTTENPIQQQMSDFGGQSLVEQHTGAENEFVELRKYSHKIPVSSLVTTQTKKIERTMSLPRRPSPPRSPPPQPPEDEASIAYSSVSAGNDLIQNKRAAPPPIPQKPISLLQKSLEAPVPPDKSSFTRFGSDRKPHRPPPPVPAPGQVPVHRAHPRPGRVLSAPAGTCLVGARISEETQEDDVSVSHEADPSQTEEAMRKRRDEQRQNVISELAFTEKEYIRDLKITYETFNLHDPKHLEARGIDCVTLFGNLLEVIQTAEKLLESIQLAMKGKEEEDQLIAPSFLDMAEELRAVYGCYCMSHENALALLDKYEPDENIQRVFQKGLETLRLQIACFDMTSILIKPVQRIMKYPLILNELIKCTDDSHKDKEHLLLAVRKMTEVASSINESKRRREIVSKYLDDGNTTLTTRMSRLSLHSVAKMSTRLSMKLSSSLGIGTIIKDTKFEEQEQMFHVVEKTIRLFVRNVEIFLTSLEDMVMTQLHCAEAIADFYQENQKVANVDEFRMVQHTLVTETFTMFKTSMENKVLQPLRKVLELSDGPSRLIQKRNDKLLDYESCLSRAEKNKDIKTQEELNLAKNNYEALNSQLLEELPTFISCTSNIYVDCIASFISARKLFSGRVTKQYLELTNLPVMTGCTGDAMDILEQFKVKHNIVCSDLGNFSFSSKSFKQENTLKRNSKLTPSPAAKVEDQAAANVEQSPSKKAYILSKYPADKLYRVCETHASAEVLELSVVEGNVVGVIKKQDPMGNSERWYVDDGDRQGFVFQKYLRPLHGASNSPSSTLQPTQQKSPLGVQKRLNMSPQQVAAAASPTNLPPPSYEEVISQSPSPQPLSDLEESQDNQSHLYEEIPEMEFYYAAYDFNFSEEHLVPLKKGQVVKVIRKHDVEGNSEWWLVEDRSGAQGYVPGNYLAKYGSN